MGKRALSPTVKYHLYEKGWAVVNVSRRRELELARDALRLKARELTEKPGLELEEFHDYVPDEATYARWYQELATFFRKEKLGHRVIEEEREFFQELLGPDLNIQSSPKLIIARPGQPRDNIDFHRDTLKGHTPYELTVSVAFVDIPDASALSVLSGSHKQADGKSTSGAEAVSLSFGQILVFSQALVHGSQVNVGECTRWTSDTAVVNSWIPLRPELEQNYYQRWCRSVVSELGEDFYGKNSRD